MEKKMNKFIKILLISSVTCSLFSGPNEDLLDAAFSGDSDGVKVAITAGADVNATNVYGSAALIRAAQNGHIDIVRLLLDYAANINAINSHGSTALIMAARYGHIDIVKLLLDRGADINIINSLNSNVLMPAAQQGHTKIVELLLLSGIDVNSRGLDGNTALIFAAEKGHTDVIRLLLDRGTNINAVNVNGTTALMFAASYGHPDTVKLLLDRGADINATNNYGETALNLARLEDYTEIVKILEETPEIKQLVDNAIQGDSSSYQKLIEKLKDLNIDSYEFNLILNRLINKIKSDKINRNSRKLLLDLAYHIAINLGSAVVGLLPEDILIPMLRDFLPYTDLEYEFDMMHLDAHNQPVKKNLLEIVYAFYKKIEKLEEIEAELKVTHVLEYE